MYRYLFIFLICFSFELSAQTDDFDDWSQISVPEHVYQYSDNGVRRMPSKMGSKQNAALTCIGSPKVPVILVQFADRRFYASGKTEDEIVHSYNLFFNGKDNEEVYNVTHSRGSIQTYFKDQSLGAFTPEFEIIGPLTLDKSYTAYGYNSSYTKDSEIFAFYREALDKAVKEKNVDWSKFDNDSNGIVDMVFFIHAGWGENVVHSYDPDAIWAKESTTSLTVNVDESHSITFGCYGVCAEARPIKSSQINDDKLSGNYGTTGYNEANLRMDGIGVCIHELSHALGLPDFYDTNNVAFGMDFWSVMDYGEYGNSGFNPVGYTAYERDFMGWQELEVLTDTTILTIECFAKGGHGYKIINENNEDEYYVIENRQPYGWDDYFCRPCHGLMITHVDYDRSRWNGNYVNTDSKHQRMTIIAANDSYLGTNTYATAAQMKESLSGNLFPYTKPSQSLTNTTQPAAKVYAGEFMNKPIYDITENEDSTITVYYLKSKADFEKDFTDEISSMSDSDYLNIYDMRGIHICKCMRDELYKYAFNRGIYLVKFSNGKVRKILLK